MAVIFAGVPFTTKQIRNTIALLKYYRAFINSDRDRAVDPESGWLRTVISKDYARARLAYLIDRAINRKARSDEYLAKLHGDRQRLELIAKRVRVYQFETYLCKRSGNLLSVYDD